MEESSISPQALSLAGLAVEFCKILAHPSELAPQEFVRECLRYIPRIYISIADLKPYEGSGDEAFEEYNTDAISPSVTEEQYDMVCDDIARVFGEYDVYLDTPVEDMRYSDTPVGISLSEQLGDIFQNMADFAATMTVSDAESAGDVLAELKYRFHAYLSETLCSSLRAANNLYQSRVLSEE